MSNKAAEKRAVSRKDMTRWQWTWKEIKNNKVAYLMVLPFMLIFTLFTIVPVALSIIFSFTDFNMLEWPNFVFAENYLRTRLAQGTSVRLQGSQARLPRALSARQGPPLRSCIYYTAYTVFERFETEIAVCQEELLSRDSSRHSNPQS